MVKIPISDEHLSPDFVEKRTQLLHDYGALLSRWGEFEVTVEVKIAKLANLDPLDASIILGGLSFGNKPAILYSLLHERGLGGVADKVQAVITHARRNALVHGVVGSDKEKADFSFFKREVGKTYEVKKIDFNADTFNDHLNRLLELIYDAEVAMDVTVEDLEEYARKARLIPPAP